MSQNSAPEQKPSPKTPPKTVPNGIKFLFGGLSG
jgi:hypothetical protein